MKVYRYASLEEVKFILRGETYNVGRFFVNIKCNSHHYNRSKKYLHFFKKCESIEEIKRIRSDIDEEYCVCEYDIPMIVLMLGRGVGYYQGKGYKNDVIKHVEYIVPSDVLKPNWLVNYKIDNRMESTNNV